MNNRNNLQDEEFLFLLISQRARLSAAVKQLQSELSVLRDREICVGMIDDMIDLIHENNRLRLENEELRKELDNYRIQQ